MADGRGSISSSLMFDRISEVLPLVTKPIRYTGGEYNARLKEPARGGVSWVLSMPDVYELGMSNYGLRILYSIINRLEGAVCDRCFCPWPDFGRQLLARELPLYALESKRPVREFDILGVSLQSELSYTNLLYLLDLCQIPLRREERTNRDPLVVCGGPCTVNPLPMAAFVDAFVIGDGEDVVREVTEVVKAWDRRRRDDILAALATLEGVYVPGKTSVGHCQDSGLRTENREVETTVRRRVVKELREEDFPMPPLVPICETTHDRLTVEIARGCSRGCRFCQAGFINRPVRFRSVDEIVRLAERGIRATGWEEASLLALSALDYPDILNLVRQLNSRLAERRVALSLPSTRGEQFSPELALELQEVKKTGLTFAPETVSSRLKALVNKDIPEAAMLESIRTALDAGWGGVKLYFMLGLPGETGDDVGEVGRFVNEIARLCRNRVVRANLSPFVPKPHTPLQWTGFEGVESVRSKIEQLKVRFGRNVKVKWENPESSYVQTLLARGDESVARVVERVYRQGGVFQEWTEYFRLDSWLNACQDEGVDPRRFTGTYSTDEPLPWGFVDVGVSRTFLKREYERAMAGEATPDCSRAGCTGCGACVESRPYSKPERTDSRLSAYRRRVRPAGYDDLRIRFRLRYTVEEPYRYAAHLDRVRALYRALRRSELPIVYTKGFSPKPMVSLGPPLPVGLLSEGEYFDLFTRLSYSGNAFADLGPFMPRGMRLVQGRVIPRDWPSLGRVLNLARYRVRVSERYRRRLADLSERSRAIGGVRSLKPVTDGFELELVIAPGVRLLSVLSSLLEADETEARSLEVVRLDCMIERDGKIVSPLEG